MALIRCSGCGREVSNQVAACPNCGAPLTPIPDSVRRVTRAGGKWGGIGFALVALGIVIGVVSNRALGSVVALAGVVLFIIGRKK
jgi:hypothetical protein